MHVLWVNYLGEPDLYSFPIQKICSPLGGKLTLIRSPLTTGNGASPSVMSKVYFWESEPIVQVSRWLKRIQNLMQWIRGNLMAKPKDSFLLKRMAKSLPRIAGVYSSFLLCVVELKNVHFPIQNREFWPVWLPGQQIRVSRRYHSGRKLSWLQEAMQSSGATQIWVAVTDLFHELG